jgi:hypothetical protein
MGVQSRYIEADVGGVRVVNLYVPNGQAPGSEKFAYKLAWMDPDLLVTDRRLIALVDGHVEVWTQEQFASQSGRNAVGPVVNPPNALWCMPDKPDGGKAGW